MPKSKIIKAVVDDEVSLSQSLTRLQVIAYDAKNSELAAWAEKELTGYSSEEDVPDYRRTTSYSFAYSGIVNYVTQVKNISLDASLIGDELLEKISKLSFTQSISSLEDMLNECDSTLKLDRSYLANAVFANSGERIQCAAIYQSVPKSVIQNALAEVKNRVLKSLIRLEEEYGNLDRLGVNISRHSASKVELVNREINSGILQIKVDSSDGKNERLGSKVAWNIVVPIITGVVCTALGALVTHLLGF